MTTPVPPTPPEVAKALRLGHNGLTCIGYWRDDPSEDPALTAPGREAQLSRDRINKLLAAGEQGGRVCIGSGEELTGLEMARRDALEYQAEADHWVQLPWPGDHCDPSMPVSEREEVAALLDGAPDLGGYRGSSYDRLAPDQTNGSREHGLAGYCWPSGLSHYVRQYGLRLDPDFLAAIAAELS